jgi:hypothetical protein
MTDQPKPASPTKLPASPAPCPTCGDTPSPKPKPKGSTEPRHDSGTADGTMRYG